MFYERKFAMVEVLLLLQILLIQSVYNAEGSIRNGKDENSMHNEMLKEQSSNQIVKAEEKAKSEIEQFYYLPMQTVFDETDTVTGTSGLSTTSPPHLNINPAPIQTNYHEKTVLHQDSSANAIYSGPYQSQCVSETPVMELESRFLLPSRDVIKESVIMSGHLEIASKTSSVEVSEIDDMASKPSIALQGTVLHSHTISDL